MARGAPKTPVNDFLLTAVARRADGIPRAERDVLGDADSADARIVAAGGAHVGLVMAVDNGCSCP